MMTPVIQVHAVQTQSVTMAFAHAYLNIRVTHIAVVGLNVSLTQIVPAIRRVCGTSV